MEVKQCNKEKEGEVEMTEWDSRVLPNYALSQTFGVILSIASLTIEVYNFEFCPTLVTFVDKEQCGTVMFNGV